MSLHGNINWDKCTHTHTKTFIIRNNGFKMREKNRWDLTCCAGARQSSAVELSSLAASEGLLA